MEIPTNRLQDQENFALPEELPVLPVPFVAFPNMLSGLTVSNPRDMALVDAVLAADRLLTLSYEPEPARPDLRPEELHPIAVVATVVKMLHLPDGDVRLLIHAGPRVFLREFTATEPFFRARLDTLEEKIYADAEEEAIARQVLELLHEVIKMAPSLQDEMYTTALNLNHPGRLADFIASSMRWSDQERLDLLDMLDCKQRLKRVLELLTREREVLLLGHKIQSEAQSSLEKTQREFMLRQQLEAIRKELGESEENPDLAQLRKRFEAADLPERVRDQAAEQLERLSRIPPASPEYGVTRDYLDWLLVLPWKHASEDLLDLRRAQRILDEDHYDLEDVKELILEALAVRLLKPDASGQIFCLVGPPGVGKTSLGRSIARAMGRKFVRMSLGGLHDEAEIRGHRRTYVGAMPGRIIRGLKRAGTCNPVFMLDEIDKLGRDFRGDPAAALLEVLDPEQNFSFEDNYLELPFDLSRVLFITTANTLDTIPEPLLDRMDVLRLPGYTREEKLFIARRFLLPRQREAAGLKASQFKLTDAALKRVIADYTREAGVRNLERRLGTLCRKAAKRLALGEAKTVAISARNLEEFLDHPPFRHERLDRRITRPGRAFGLAWTPVGGEVLEVEALVLPSKGETRLVLTGRLGEVMRESAQLAFSLVRSRFKHSRVPLEGAQIHLHVPAGAVPKDGPSAGITLATVLASLFTGRCVRSDLAMTGEITLGGRLLPVGGIKEKVLGALRAGLKTLILPEANLPDLDKLSDEIRAQLTFHGCRTVDEVFRLALLPPEKPAKKRKKS